MIPAQGHADTQTTTIPGSPPDMTGSKSSKSSSFHSSYQSDDNNILTNVANFEEIGLDDEARGEPHTGDYVVKSSLNPYDASFAADLRATARQQKRAPMSARNGNRPQRELTASPYRSPGMPPRSTTTDGLVLLPMHNGRNSTPVGLGLLPLRNGPKPKGAPNASRRVFMNPSTSSLPLTSRNRSSSPALRGAQKHNLPVSQLRVRRGSWQSNRGRKSAEELERECDDDDGDDVPDDCFLENIPISPRPPLERAVSMPPSASTSPERAPKERVRSVGNGTSPIPAEQGELRTPKPLVRSATMSDFPMNGVASPKGRAKSWTAVRSELSAEAQALTEALEAHAEDEQNKALELRQRRSFGNGSTTDFHKPARVRSAIAELPPLRRTNIMIDPLPVSKEKEAVLSRTRPSWLPPKDPAEEKRHLKEYQKMMAQSAESDRKREAEQRAKSTCKDDTVSSLLRIWEEHVLPNWDNVIRQKRTRELWWRGIAPRSRGKVWAKAVGNELGLSDASYTAALRRAQALEKTVKGGSQLTVDEERKRGWLDRIEADVKQTFSELRIFQPDGPLYEPLKDVLKAYAMYRSDVGYVHGTNVSILLHLSRLFRTC